MLKIILIIFFSYTISVLAKRKGQNSLIWVFIALIAFFITLMIGAFVLVLLSYKGEYTISDMQAFMETPVRSLIILFSGAGGYLLIRYILERMPDADQRNNNVP